MRKYDKYKDSGIEWIGEIPEHWEVKKLKYLTLIGNGKDHKEVWDVDGEYPIIDTGGKFGNANSFLYDKPSIILGRKGTIDKPRYIEIPFWAVDTAYFTIIKENTFPKYLYYLTTTINFDLYKYGSAVPSINQEVLKEIYFAVPDKNEQTAIADYLDRKTAEIDQLIADKKRLLELYEEEKTAIINELVTGKKIWNDNAWAAPAEVKDSGIEWLGEIPEHWEVKKLKYVAEINLGKMLAKEDKGGMYLKPYLRAANIGWLNVDISDVKEMWFSKNELSKLRLEKNDLLVSEGGEVGRTCIWENEMTECYIQNSVHKVTINKDNNPSYFLNQFYLFGQKGAFDFIVNRISIAHLTVEKLREVEFIIPPLDEQQTIVRHIESESARIDAKKQKTEKLIDLLTEYRTALISEVVTGKIKVI